MPVSAAITLASVLVSIAVTVAVAPQRSNNSVIHCMWLCHRRNTYVNASFSVDFTFDIRMKKKERSFAIFFSLHLLNLPEVFSEHMKIIRRMVMHVKEHALNGLKHAKCIIIH